MNLKFKSMLSLLGVSITLLMGCKKHVDDDITITATNLIAAKPGTLTGTFTATGDFNTSGTHVMVVQPVGTDSIYCTTTFTSTKGTIGMNMQCSIPNMTGNWQFSNGTGAYSHITGSGTLIMTFPPDPSVPAGALGIETMTGVAWFR